MRQIDVHGRVGRVPVIEAQVKALEIPGAARGDSRDELLRADSFLLRLEHDRCPVRVVGAHEVQPISMYSLEAHPDVRLDVLGDVPNVERGGGVGERRGYEYPPTHSLKSTGSAHVLPTAALTDTGSGGTLELLELRLVDGLLVGFLARDLALVHQLLDRAIHRAHAELTTRLHGVLELIELALADEVGCGRGVHEDLERGDPALLVGALQQLLRHHSAERSRQHGRTWDCLSEGNTFTMRSTVCAAPLVCSVPMTRIPISAAVTAMLMVSRSRSSPTRITSGSSRRAECTAAAKL